MKCGSNVATTKSTTLYCNVPIMFQNNVVGMVYMKCNIYNIATTLWYSPNYNVHIGGITVYREKMFFILLQFKLCLCNII